MPTAHSRDPATPINRVWQTQACLAVIPLSYVQLSGPDDALKADATIHSFGYIGGSREQCTSQMAQLAQMEHMAFFSVQNACHHRWEVLLPLFICYQLASVLLLHA